MGLLHIPTEKQVEVLNTLKSHFKIEELLYLNTCNRVELYIKNNLPLNSSTLIEIINIISPNITNSDLIELCAQAEVYQNELAVKHLFKVASSLNSLVIGEREIITQVRKAYENCQALELTGDFIRLLIKQTIEIAKDIYTNTNISKNPISIVSLAYRRLREIGIKNSDRFLIIGSGETNTLMGNYLKKHKYANFIIFNRTVSNASNLAKALDANIYSLNELNNYKGGFDVIIICTAHTGIIINHDTYKNLLGGDKSKKVIVDLSMPSNVSKEVAELNTLHYINITSLKNKAEQNIELRKNEIEKCEKIISEKITEFNQLHKERRIELAFGEIPKQVKAINQLALSEVFAKEIDTLDENGKIVIEKVLNYIEKKYNAVAIKTAKELLLKPRN